MKPRRIISYIILCVLVPAAVVGGSLLFGDKQYAYLTLCVAVLSCLPFFLHFEHGRADAKEMILIAAMVALSVVGRFLFAPIPGFKPVTAMTVITAMYFGSEAGFMTGALSAVISNFYFGQGPWTPFQMLSWGLIGIIGGFCRSMQGKILPMIIGFLATVFVYGPILNFASLLLVTNTPTWNGFWMMEASGFLFDVVHGVSTIVFVYFAGKPMRKKLVRMQEKYGICRRK